MSTPIFGNDLLDGFECLPDEDKNLGDLRRRGEMGVYKSAESYYNKWAKQGDVPGLYLI